MKTLLSLSLLALAAAPALATDGANPSARLLSTPRDTFASKMIVRDDPLEAATLVSTERGHRSFGSHPSKADTDSHLVAHVDRRTGAAHYEVRYQLRHFGPQRDYQAVHYQAGGSVQKAALGSVTRDGDHCPFSEYNTECVRSSVISFAIDENVVKEIAARHATTPQAAWSFKLKDSGQRDAIGHVAPAEAAALLDRVGTLRARTTAAS
jgi:hypothetical protein